MLALTLFAEDATQNVGILVATISTVGLIVVALIGVLTAKITSGAKRDAQSNAEQAQVNAEEASKSAAIAKDFANALEAKDALVQSLKERVDFVERLNDDLKRRITDLEERIDENDEARRAAHLIEHAQQEEITELRSIINAIRSKPQ